MPVVVAAGLAAGVFFGLVFGLGGRQPAIAVTAPPIKHVVPVAPPDAKIVVDAAPPIDAGAPDAAPPKAVPHATVTFDVKPAKAEAAITVDDGDLQDDGKLDVPLIDSTATIHVIAKAKGFRDFDNKFVVTHDVTIPIQLVRKAGATHPPPHSPNNPKHPPNNPKHPPKNPPKKGVIDL